MKRPWPVRNALLACLLVCLCCLFGAPAAQAETPAEIVRMGFYIRITRDLSRAEVQSALEFWAQELSEKFGVTTQVRFYDDMRALRKDFDRGQVNFVITSSMDFVRHFKIEELAEGFVGSHQTDHTQIVLTRSDSGIRDLKHMAGKRIALLRDDELSEIYLETLCLSQFRRACKEVFSGIETLDNSNKLVMRLFFGKTDLILTRQSGLELAKELNPQIGASVQVVRQFSVKSSYFGFFGSNVDKSFRTRALSNIPTMHLEARGKQVLEVFKLDKLEIAAASDLLPFVRLYQDYEALRAEIGRKKGGR